MTSAHSQRRLAALAGVSHQQVGRWLKPKDDGTYRKIPDIYQDGINQAFDIHKSIAKDQAKIDQIPYSDAYPVYLHRGLLTKKDKDGNPVKGDRVIATDTQWLDHSLRERFLRAMYKTGKFDYATIRSFVDVLKYADNKAQNELDENPNRRISRATLAAKILASFYGSDNVKQIQLGNYAQHFYTQKEFFGMDANNESQSIHSLLSKLRQKHEPAAINLADEFVFQTYPANYVRNKATKSKSQKNTRSNLKRK